MTTTKGSDSGHTVAHFDRIVAEYRAHYDQATPVGYRFTVRRQRVLDLFDAPGGKVLDVGCGPGVMAEALVDRGCSFWGVDPAAGMIDEATTAFGSTSAKFSVGSAESLDFPDAFFDAVICMGVLERIADDDAALAEMVRVLKVDGTLIVTLPNRLSPALQWRDHVFYPVVALLRPVHRWLTRAAKHEVIRGHRRYGRRSFAASMAHHGCVVTDVDYCCYPILLAPLDALFPGLARATMQKAERLRDGPLRALGSALIVKAKKRAPRR